jgi:photosystem II stability/assembly factor-like uncharacterized protein
MKSSNGSTWQNVPRPKIKLVAMLLLAMAATTPKPLPAGDNAWTRIGPEGGAIGALVVDPQNLNTIYAAPMTGSNGAVFKSTDGGSTWMNTTPLPCCSALTAVNVLVIDTHQAGTVYAGTQGGGVFKTSDGATSWIAVSSGLPTLPSSSSSASGPYAAVEALAIDPQDSNIIYAGTAAFPFGAYKSINGGESWSVASSGLPDRHSIISLAIDPQNTSTVYTSCEGGGLYKSVNGGATWSAANAGMRPFSSDRPLLIDPKNPTTLYTWNGDGLFRSTDGAATWSQPKPGLPDWYLYSMVMDPNNGTLYAGICCSGLGLVKSTDGGANWSALKTGFSLNGVGGGGNGFITLASDPLGGVYIAHGGYFAKSGDGGTNWSPVSFSGLVATYVRTLAVDARNPGALYAGVGAPGLGGLYKTMDGGANWRRVGLPTGTGVSSLVVDPKDFNTLYASNGEGSFKSRDGGTNWTVVSGPFFSLTIDPQNTSTLYSGIGDAGGVSKSMDGGATWSTASSGLPTAPNGRYYQVNRLAIDWKTPAILYASISLPPPNDPLLFGTYGAVYKSTDGAASWTALSSSPSCCVQDLAIDPQNSATVYVVSGHDGIIKSTDGGDTWAAVNSGLPSVNGVQALLIDPVNSGTIYGRTYGGGVYRSIDGGASWSTVNDGLTNLNIQTLAIDSRQTSSTVYAGTSGGGVFAITFAPKP